MRLKQALGIILPLMLISLSAAGSQLMNVDAQANGAGASAVVIRANGKFTHTEYRPSETLLLVDLAGVSTGTMDTQTHKVDAPGVESYRVLTYTGTNGAEVARVELSLQPHSTVSFQEESNTLKVNVATEATSAALAPETRTMTATRAPRTFTAWGKAATQSASDVGMAKGTPVQVRNVAVARAGDGMDIEITANRMLVPKVSKLTAPDRVVIDLLNAVPLTRQREIRVNSGNVKMVRIGHYQNTPPITRVVADLAVAQEYKVIEAGNKLIVNLHAATPSPARPAASAQVAVNSPQRATPPIQSKLVMAKAESAKDFVVLEPQYQQKAAQPDPAVSRATQAAHKFTDNKVEIPLTNGPLVPINASLKPQPALNLAALPQQPAAAAAQGAPAAAPASCNTGRYTGEPISVNLKEVDLRDFFRLIHEISGLNIILDPGVHGSLTLVLDDVPWDQALNIVLKNNGLDCQLEGNVLRIATTGALKAEADARRAQIEAQALALEKVTVTRYLSYADAKGLVPTIKQFMSSRGDIIADDRTNSLLISDIPTTIPNIDRLIKELDRKTKEVEIEARVVAATRNFSRDIGTQLGFGWGNRPSAVGGVSQVGISPIQDNVPTAPQYIIVGTKQIPLFSNLPAPGATSGISFITATNNYRLDFLLTLAESRGLLKILSRPRIVTQNNISGVVRQGVRIPVVTAAQLGGPPTTTYVDAFLRLTVKPQITAEGTIFMNVDVENTQPDFSNQVNGNPSLLTQQATTSVLVSDGGTVVIGGVIQTTSNVNIQQTPLLGNIPVFGNLFKRRAVSTSTQELVFFITPRIIQT